MTRALIQFHTTSRDILNSKIERIKKRLQCFTNEIDVIKTFIIQNKVKKHI